jgi:hypothetical protein
MTMAGTAAAAMTRAQSAAATAAVEIGGDLAATDRPAPGGFQASAAFCPEWYTA